MIGILGGAQVTTGTFNLETPATNKNGYFICQYYDTWAEVKAVADDIADSTQAALIQSAVGGKEGSGYRYSIRRAWMRFDTTAIPVGATVVSAKLRLWPTIKQFANTLEFAVCPSATDVILLTAGDVELIDLTTQFASKLGTDITTGQWNEWTFNPEGRGGIVKEGYTELWVTTLHDINNIDPQKAGTGTIQCYGSGGSNPPELQVVYIQ